VTPLPAKIVHGLPRRAPIPGLDRDAAVYFLKQTPGQLPEGTTTPSEYQRIAYSDPSGAQAVPFSAALEAGLVRPGQAYNSNRWRQFGYRIEAFAAIKRLPPGQRRAAASHPERFLAVLDTGQ
jgi:hypothetical protein